MSYFLYIIYSRKFNRTYTGQTDNLDKRLAAHNSGKVRSTKHYIPWTLIHSEEFTTRAEAMKREKWYKSKVGREAITDILKSYLENNSETNGLSDSSR